jgi:hypothetical protein
MQSQQQSLSVSEKDKERFWSKVDKSAGPNECWPWKSAAMKNRYGVFTLHGKTQLAHRVSAILSGIYTTNAKPFICHKCDNPACCNPAHFFIGDSADNMADMRAKGRHLGKNKARGIASGSYKHPERLPRGDNHWTRKHPERIPRGNLSGARKHPERYPRGEKSYLAKLTEAEAASILTALKAGLSQRKIAKRFGVCQATVGHIATGRNWNHVWKKFNAV